MKLEAHLIPAEEVQVGDYTMRQESATGLMYAADACNEVRRTALPEGLLLLIFRPAKETA